MSIIAGAVASGGFLAGVAALAMGLRGRPIDDHPLCRRCRFDLLGLQSPSVCPECGTALAGKARIGNRTRRRGMIALGILLLLGALGLGGAAGWSAASGFNWNTVKPAWWLAGELESPDAGVADAAAAELLARSAAQSLSAHRWRDLVQRGLRVQANPLAPWSDNIGQLMEQARRGGHMSESELVSYVREGTRLALDARLKVRQDGPVPIRLSLRMARLGGGEDLKIRMKMLESHVGGVSAPFTPGSGSVMSLSARSSSSLLTVQRVPSLPTGPQEVRQRWRFALQEGYDSDAPELGSWEEEFTAPFEVMETGKPGAVLVEHDGIADLICTRLRLRATVHVGEGGAARATCHLDMPNLPVGAAFDIYWRIADAEAPAGRREVLVHSMSFPRGTMMGTVFDADVPPEFAVDSIDLVLRSNPAVAESSVDLIEVWDGEVVIENMPIEVKRRP